MSTNPIPSIYVLHNQHVQLLGCHFLINNLNSFSEEAFLIFAGIMFQFYNTVSVPLKTDLTFLVYIFLSKYI